MNVENWSILLQYINFNIHNCYVAATLIWSYIFIILVTSNSRKYFVQLTLNTWVLLLLSISVKLEIYPSGVPLADISLYRCWVLQYFCLCNSILVFVREWRIYTKLIKLSRKALHMKQFHIRGGSIKVKENWGEILVDFKEVVYIQKFNFSCL